MEKDSVLQEDLALLAREGQFEKLRHHTVLVTGATGLIGSQLVRALAYCNKQMSLQMQILALVRSPEKAERIFGTTEGFTVIKGDVTTPFAEYLPKNIKIDDIIHAASITASKMMISNPTETISTSLDGTKHMLELAKKYNAVMLYISSMEIYGVFAQEKDVSEEDMGYLNPLAVRSNYPLCKRMCENMCIAYHAQFGIPVRIARLSQTFGAGILPGENRVFAQFAKSVILNENIVLHTKGLSQGNYCYTRDTVTALILLLNRGKDGQAYNISNEETHTTIADMAHLVAEKIAGGKIQVIYDIPKENTYGYAAETKMKLNTAKIRALGWQPEVGLEEAYRRLIQSMRETNFLNL